MEMKFQSLVYPVPGLTKSERPKSIIFMEEFSSLVLNKKFCHTVKRKNRKDKVRITRKQEK